MARNIYTKYFLQKLAPKAKASAARLAVVFLLSMLFLSFGAAIGFTLLTALLFLAVDVGAVWLSANN